MTKYLADFEVESHGMIPKQYDTLQYKHPKGDYEVHLKNLDASPKRDCALLSVQLILDARDLEEAYGLSRERLREFLRFFTLVTSCTFTYRTVTKIIDWTPGLTKRKAYRILAHSDPNIPLPVIHPEFLESVTKLMSEERPTELDRAIKWYSKGVSAYFLDEQFQYFWLAIELLAELHKPSEKVADRCPKCRKDLYCHTCKETPQHRPYPKQAIESLIRKRLDSQDPQKLIDHFDKLRNTLFHGGDLKKLEATMEISLEKQVNALGNIVFAALISSFKLPKGTTNLNLATTNRYSHYEMAVKATVEFSMKGDPENPKIEDVPNMNLELVVHENEEYDDKPHKMK